MTLTRKILLFTLALCVVIGVLAQIEAWRIGRDQQQQLQANVVDLKQLLRQFSVLPAILASDPRMTTALAEAHAVEKKLRVDQANKVLLTATDKSDAAFAFIMDTSGLTIAASNFEQPVSFIGKNYGFRPYFTKAMTDHAATYFAVGATTGIPGYFVSEPIKQDGKILGVVAVKLEPQQLPQSWQTSFQKNEGRVAVVLDELKINRRTLNEKMTRLGIKR